MKLIPCLLLLSLLSCKKDTPLPRTNLCGKTLVFIGDSQFADYPWLKSIPRWYAELTGQSVVYAGVGGQTSTECADRYEATIECKDCPVAIIVGRNNSWQSDRIKDDLRRIIGNKTEYFIFEIVTADIPGEEPGTDYWQHDQELNAEIRTIWGPDHFIELTQSLQALDPSDEISRDKGIAPLKFRRDELHLNSEGNYEAAKLLIAHLMPCQTPLN